MCAAAQEIIQCNSRKRSEAGERAVRTWKVLNAMVTSLNFAAELMENVGG